MAKNQILIEYLKTRRTIVAPDLSEPAPSEAELNDILTIAARVPDHGKLAPWRFLVIHQAEAVKLDAKLAEIYAGHHPDLSEMEQANLDKQKLSQTPLVVCVIARSVDHPKIPQWEQNLSAGAVCMNLIHAVHAYGFNAHWVTRWFAFDHEAHALLGLSQSEQVAGFIHIGTASTPPQERPRPDIQALTTNWTA